MIRIIKTIILISVFALLTIVSVSALNSNSVDGLLDLADIQSELASLKSTRGVSKVVNSAVKELNNAISQGGQSCNSRLQNIISKLENAATLLENKSCSKSKRKKCVSDESVNKILTRLQSSIMSLKELSTTDENGNGSPDLCESDPDSDGVIGKNDNCPFISNPEQKDADRNNIGDACDLFLCCEDSSLTFPVDQCERKTIKSCSEGGNVVIGCIPSKPKSNKRRKANNDDISFEPTILSQTNGQNIINFGTGASPSVIMISTGFFPFNNSQAVLQGFSDFMCDDFDVSLTPPPNFPGGAFEIGPAANGAETGSRTMIQIIGDMALVIPLNDFPITNPSNGQPFNPAMGDQLGLSLFTQDQAFANSSFSILADLDFDGSCTRSPVASSSGSIFDDPIVIPIGPIEGTSGGTTTNTSGGAAGGTSSGFLDMLQQALSMSTVPVNMGGMAYMATTYDCDDFADDLAMELSGQGFNTTFTLMWMNNGMNGHAVTDVHPTTSGGVVFVEPQNGMIIDLDENMDGMVGFRDGMHSMTVVNTEGMTEIEVYMNRGAAEMAGAPID